MKKRKKQPYRLKRKYHTETGRTMKTLNNGRVRLYGAGPIVALSTAARIYMEADDLEKSIGEILDAWSELCPPLERERAQYDEDEPVPMHP